MSLEIFDDDKTFISVLKGKLSDKVNVYLVNIHLKESEFARREHLAGLNKALELDPTEKPIILYGYTTKKLREDQRFIDLMNRKRVVFLEMPVGPEQILALYDKLLKTK
jgi:hypothetical protein